MRRIVAILLVAFIIFWIAYGLLEPWRNIVNGFAVNVAGPAAFGFISGIYQWIIATIGFAGFSGIVLIFGVICGIFAYKYWHQGDWWLRRKFAGRTARDLGTAPVTQYPGTTPPGATTRPVATTPPAPLPPVTEEVKPTAPEPPAKEAEQ